MPIKIGNVKAYTIEETSKLLGITTRTLKTYIKKKKIQAAKLGRRVYIAERYLEDFILGKTGD